MEKTGINNQKTTIHHALTASDLSLTNVQKPTSLQGFSTWVRALLQNWRQGTVAVKGRSDVSFSNKKPWKQKGTGRARAGSARSPLWRGGGVTFGPQERSKTLRVTKKMKKSVLADLLFDRLNAKNIVSLDWQMNSDKPKTSAAFQALRQAELVEKPITLFLSVHDMITFASFANISNVRILFFDQPNAFDLAYSNQWVVLKKDIELFKQMVSQWI